MISSRAEPFELLLGIASAWHCHNAIESGLQRGSVRTTLTYARLVTLHSHHFTIFTNVNVEIRVFRVDIFNRV